HGRRAAFAGAGSRPALRRAGGGRLLERFHTGASSDQGSHAAVLPPSEAGRASGGAYLEPLPGSPTGAGRARDGNRAAGAGGGYRRRYGGGGVRRNLGAADFAGD